MKVVQNSDCIDAGLLLEHAASPATTAKDIKLAARKSGLEDAYIQLRESQANIANGMSRNWTNILPFWALWREHL